MWHLRVLLLNTLALATACGTSRSTRNQNCSNLKAVVDPKVAPAAASTMESYDPSAVLLLFTAKADKVTIESRCNARLVNKMVAKHKLSDGQLVDALAPINFEQLELEFHSGESNFELHSSAHCFYRVWDSRISNQVKNNPAIGVEPARSLLRDLKTRYQLYRSMLTTPQKIVAYLPNGTPISFDYKTEATPLYEQFFAAIDAAKSTDLEAIIGREFSKTSLLMDELISDGCRTDEKMLSELGKNAVEAAKSVTDPMGIATFRSQHDSISKTIDDLIRSRYMVGGRRKLCFSQTDMLALPVKFSGTLSAVQKNALSEIEKLQKSRIENFLSHLKGANKEKFIAEIKPSTIPQNTPAGIDRCAWSDTYPGFSITDSFSQLMERKYFNNWTYSRENGVAGFTSLKFLFPNMDASNPIYANVVKDVTQLVYNTLKCGASGMEFIPETGSCQANTNEGRCPPIANPLSPTPAEDMAAQSAHLHIVKSMRLASTSPLHLLRRMRESSSLALTMPVTSLNDFVVNRCQTSADPECELSKAVDQVLKNLAGRFSATIDSAPPGRSDSRQTVDLVAQNNLLQFTSIDDDLQFHCKFSQRTLSNNDNSASLFRNLSDEAKSILDADATAGAYNKWSMGSRFLFLKCISVGMQRLYNDPSTYSGLLHGIGFAQVSFVKSDVSEARDAYGIGNVRMTELGRPVSLPFVGMFLGEDSQNLLPVEKAAKLLAGPHLQLQYCASSGASGTGLCGNLLDSTTLSLKNDVSSVISDLPLVRSHLNFTTSVPDWLPEAEKAKYGSIAFPADNYSTASGRYYFSAGDSGTTIAAFGLFPIFMLSTVQDRPVSGGLAVIPSTGGQEVQSSKGASCR